MKKCILSEGKQGRIHGNPVANGWAGAVMQKPLGIQFHPNWSIQSGDISKIVKNIKIDHQIHLIK